MIAADSKFGRFIVEKMVGSGSNGTVYRAHSIEGNKTVAIKLLADHLAKDKNVLTMFDEEAKYRRVRDSEVITRTGIADMFGRDPDDIIVVNHDVALAIKVSFPRPQSSGSKYDSDVYGGQQYAPLLSLEVPS